MNTEKDRKEYNTLKQDLEMCNKLIELRKTLSCDLASAEAETEIMRRKFLESSISQLFVHDGTYGNDFGPSHTMYSYSRNRKRYYF